MVLLTFKAGVVGKGPAGPIVDEKFVYRFLLIIKLFALDLGATWLVAPHEISGR